MLALPSAPAFFRLARVSGPVCTGLRRRSGVHGVLGPTGVAARVCVVIKKLLDAERHWKHSSCVAGDTEVATGDAGGACFSSARHRLGASCGSHGLLASEVTPPRRRRAMEWRTPMALRHPVGVTQTYLVNVLAAPPPLGTALADDFIAAATAAEVALAQGLALSVGELHWSQPRASPLLSGRAVRPALPTGQMGLSDPPSSLA